MGKMYVKLSFRNVKRSFKDYTIYFLTLTVAVCIFYSFNSLEAQQVMLDFSNSQRATVEQLMELISAVSIFVSVILGFLILFANNFLIKRRKKELGMYLTLGMSKYGVSRILIMETLLIGAISLVVGLLIGIVLSQGFSVFTAMLFDVNITKYEFIFSVEAMEKTIFYFSMTFILVIIFNSIVMSRYTIISLLTAGKKNEQVKIRKTATSVFLFILSVLSLAVAYIVIWKNGLMNMKIVWFCVGLGSFGTLLFFMSLSGFALKLLQQSERFYFKELNMFVSRQINSKVNSTFVSMSIICIMLFFTLGVLSTSFSIKSALENDLAPITPYDASFDISVDEGVPKIEDALKKVGIDISKYGDYWEFKKYETKETMKQIILPYIDKEKEFSIGWFDSTIEVIKRSDYEQLMKLQQKSQVH
ncbi:MAG: FtsX-like permease family protein [Bacillaceae bacterium]